MLGIGIQLKLSVSVSCSMHAMRTVTHLLQPVLEFIQIICSGYFCNKGTGGEKKRMVAINYVLVLYCCTMFSVFTSKNL